MPNSRYITILAGGIGSRFWPSSTEETPKQFLDIIGTGKSLLQMTYERCLGVVPNDNILILTNRRYRDKVMAHLSEVPLENILLEPSMNNTAPAIAYAALHIKARNSMASFAVLPSDHVIQKEDEFVKRLHDAFSYIENNNALLTLGITPTRPDIGYGYIEVHPTQFLDSSIPQKVLSFKEKPPIEIANEYLASGNYLWNAGMFIWKVNDLIAAFEKHAPGILSTLDEDPSIFNTEGEKEYIERVYPSTQNISIDYAILEKATNVNTIPADIGWSDLGTWSSLYAFIDKSENGNVHSSKNFHITDVKNSLLHSDQSRPILVRGLDGFVIVDSHAGLLIYPLSEEQELKNEIKNMKKNKL